MDFGICRFIPVGGDFSADEDVVGFSQKFINEGLFILYFCTADDDEDGMGGIFSGGGEIFDFMVNEEPGNDGEEIFHCVGGGVGAVDDSEAILDIEVGVSGVNDGFDEIFIVLFFAWVETEIF